MSFACFQLERQQHADVLRLCSENGTNRLTRHCVLALTDEIERLAESPRPLIIAGNDKFFSVGADLNEVASLTAPEALVFAHMGQALMNAIDGFPSPVCAVIDGYCMGGGLDLVLATHYRIASSHAMFGHRGAALGLITGWGGTQRLPRLIGKGRALQMFLAAEKIDAAQALQMGLLNQIANDPITAALTWIEKASDPSGCG